MSNSCCGANVTNGELVNTSGSISADTGYFNTIIDTAGGDTTTIDGVNPLTTANTLAANVNQDVRTSASPTFAAITVPTINRNVQINQSGLSAGQVVNAASGPFVDIETAGVPVLQLGQTADGLTTFIDSVSGVSALSLQTANAERIRIPGTGIPNDNTIGNMLGLNGTTLSYKNNIVDLTSAQRLSSKNIAVPSCKLVDNSDATNIISFNASAAVTGTLQHLHHLRLRIELLHFRMQLIHLLERPPRIRFRTKH